MAILVRTQTPKTLLSQIKTFIDEDKIKTWEIDKDGDFVRTGGQWAYNAWFRPSIAQGLLMFGLLGKENEIMSKLVYANYHSELLDLLLRRFDEDFDTAIVTAKGNEIDNFKTQPR